MTTNSTRRDFLKISAIGAAATLGTLPLARSAHAADRGPNILMKSLHPGRVSPKALEYLREVVEYGFGNSSGPDFVEQFERGSIFRL